MNQSVGDLLSRKVCCSDNHTSISAQEGVCETSKLAQKHSILMEESSVFSEFCFCLIENVCLFILCEKPKLGHFHASLIKTDNQPLSKPETAAIELNVGNHHLNVCKRNVGRRRKTKNRSPFSNKRMAVSENVAEHREI